MLCDGWKEFSLEILNEVEKKRKLDRATQILFFSMLSQDTEKLMEKKGCLHYERHYETTDRVQRETSIPIAKCSRADFLRKLKTSDYREYRKLIRNSLNPGAGSHREHSYLKKITCQRLRQKGYKVFDIDRKEEREKAINKLRESNQGNLAAICMGRDRYPDLVAFKGKEPLIVEVASLKKQLVRQLNYDQMAGKTMLVVPIPVEDLEIWGVSQLYNE